MATVQQLPGQVWAPDEALKKLLKIVTGRTSGLVKQGWVGCRNLKVGGSAILFEGPCYVFLYFF